MTSTLEGVEPNTRLDRAVEALACLFAFAIPWANLVVIPILGTGPRAIGILLTGSWLVSVLINDRLRPLTRYHHVAYLFVAWLGVSVFWSPDRLHSLDAALQYIQLFVLTAVIWNVFSTARQLVRLKLAYVLGCWATFGILAYNFVVGEVTEWERRASLTNYNSNEVGLLLCLALPMAWYLATSGDPIVRQQVGRLRLANFFYIGAGLVGIMLTASRGSFLSATPFAIYLVYSMRDQSPQRRVLLGILISTLLAGASFFVPETAWDRISTIPQSVADRDFGARYEIWTELLGYAFASVPTLLFGNGVSASDVLVNDAHNLIISVFVGTGLVGLTLFVVMFGAVIRSALAMPTGPKAMWLTVLATFFMGSVAYSSDAHKVTWLICGAIVAERWVAASGPTIEVEPESTDVFKMSFDQTPNTGESTQNKALV